MIDVVIVDTGVANVASVLSAFGELGVATRLSNDPCDISKASHIVLPGVGDFEAGMLAVRESGMDLALMVAFEANMPILAICLGMQMLCAASDEAAGVPGLGIIPATCKRLPDGVLVPQLGWNRVVPDRGIGVVLPGYAAFANSYAVMDVPEGWQPSFTEYGGRFVSALERGRTLACQFHPELSGAWGLRLISRWLKGESDTMVDAPASQTSSRENGLHRIIPCLDVRDGRVVKGVQFQNLRDAGNPAELAAEYERQGADEIVVLDIAAAPRGLKTRLDTVREIRERLHIPLTVGGGIRSVDDARLLLAAGADRISVNTAAVDDPGLLTRLADAFGSQCVTLAVDARQNEQLWEVLTVGGSVSTGLSVVEWARKAASLGAGEILLTSWDRDGTRSGAEIELISAVTGALSIPAIASGGIGNERDAADAIVAGASAVLAASIFHDRDCRVNNIKNYLNSEGLGVRL